MWHKVVAKDEVELCNRQRDILQILERSMQASSGELGERDKNDLRYTLSA
jgi:hypothetical protein